MNEHEEIFVAKCKLFADINELVIRFIAEIDILHEQRGEDEGIDYDDNIRVKCWSKAISSLMTLVFFNDDPDEVKRIMTERRVEKNGKDNEIIIDMIRNIEHPN